MLKAVALLLFPVSLAAQDSTTKPLQNAAAFRPPANTPKPKPSWHARWHPRSPQSRCWTR